MKLITKTSFTCFTFPFAKLNISSVACRGGFVISEPEVDEHKAGDAVATILPVGATEEKVLPAESTWAQSYLGWKCS